ncbi:MAG TPA: polysaccharide deacetylase family protein [Candidatus Polarisedimenticolia bacterium]|nr:polysaccharide deacetylase family protein [Candidatus Polarisedimenticolia bacterium]
MLTFLAVVVALLLLGAASFVLSVHAQEHRPDRIPALLYHRLISKERYDRGEIRSEERSYVVFDAFFAAQMEALQRAGYTTLHLDDYLKIRRGEMARPERPILVTFDDGFRSNYLYAFPVLRRLGMKATIFMTPDRSSRNFEKNAPLDGPLSDDELREMSAAGVAIESHGMTHRYLTDLDDHTIRWELAESRRVLEATLGRPVRFLAIPSGAYNGTIRRLAQDTGYAAVFSMGKGTMNMKSDLLALKRLVVGRDLDAAGLLSLLEPGNIFLLRLTSTVQVTFMRVFGVHTLDRLRALILKLPFGAALIRRPAVLLAAGLSTLAVLGALLVSLLWRS